MFLLSDHTPEKKSTFFGGAAILAAGIAIVKLIGALYKIPLGNILGDEGFGHFNNAYVIFNLLLMISTAGLPVALSKTISEANALGRRNQVHRVFRVALITFFVLGATTSVVMYAFAGPLAKWQGDGLAFQAVRALAPSCFFVCVLSTFRGYAQGHGNMVPTSVSQVVEAVGKLLIGLGLAWVMVQRGARSEDSAAGAIFGVTAGAGIALLYLIFDYIRHRTREAEDLRDRPESHRVILRRLLAIAIPITLCSAVTPITSWLDTAQVQNILRDVMHAQPAQWYKDNGITDPVVAMYGSYQKAMTIYNLPSSFMVALTASVIPAISACRARRNQRGAGHIAESALRVGALLACPAGIGLIALAGPIMKLLYPTTNHAVADPSMAILGAASIFVCIMLLCNAILQANGFVNLPIAVMVVGCAAKLLVNNFMVKIIGAVGAPVGTLTCYTIIAVAELVIIKRVIPAAPQYFRVFGKPLVASALMGVCAWAFHGLLVGHLGNGLATLGAICVAIVVYGILVLALRAISKEDLALMPKGDRIAKILRL